MSSLNRQILIASVVGVVLGCLLHPLPEVNPWREGILYVATLVSSVFIGLLKMLIVPLVFVSVCTGVAQLQHHAEGGRVWRLTLLCFMATMFIAIVLAMGASHLFPAGAGMNLAMFGETMAASTAKPTSINAFFQQIIGGLFMNPFAAFASGQVLPILIFALILGAAMAKLKDQAAPVLDLFQRFLALMMCILDWVMRLAPLGILALLTKLVAQQSLPLLLSLVHFIVLVFATTIIHGAVILPALVWFFAKSSPLDFLKHSTPALITAFTTSSSSATLPITLKCASKLNIPPALARFIVPLGATINMDGTALYEAAAALFIAQLAGIDLTFSTQIIIVFTAMIAAMGAPGIPSAGMVTMILVLQAAGLPVEAIAILLPIDRLLDTVRTAVNVEGDLAVSMVVKRYCPHS
jgi:Na+/H+-dicarboxylate symporter